MRSRRWPRRLLLALGTATFVYITLTAMLWWNQESLLFNPVRQYTTLPKSAGLDHEDVDIAVDAGTTIRGWFIPASGRSLGTILYFHGNAENLSAYLQRIAPFAAAGFDSLSIDYEGYGASSGSPSETNLYRNADAAWIWLTRTKGVEPDRIIVWGYSLGGAAATWCAANHEVGAVVLESTFTTIPDVGAHVYPWLPVKLISRYQFSNLDRISTIRAPVLIGHGATDQLVPFTMGEELYRAAGEPKRLVKLSGGHNDAIVQNSAAWGEVRHFLESAGFR